MHDNDKTIEDYKKKIKAKRTNLGKAPIMNFKSNGVIQIEGKVYNLHTLDYKACRELLEEIILKLIAADTVNDLLGTEDIPTIREVPIQYYIDDTIQRIDKLRWQTRKKELDVMDEKLSNLLSDKAKTENTIKDIGKELNLD